jgi:hypothetical protein
MAHRRRTTNWSKRVTDPDVDHGGPPARGVLSGRHGALMGPPGSRPRHGDEVVSAPTSPWQNPYVERVIGSSRRECLDHVIVLNHRLPLTRSSGPSTGSRKSAVSTTPKSPHRGVASPASLAVVYLESPWSAWSRLRESRPAGRNAPVSDRMELSHDSLALRNPIGLGHLGRDAHLRADVDTIATTAIV